MQDRAGKKLQWAISVGLVFLLLEQKGTYWFRTTYLKDLKVSFVALIAGALIGYLLGLIVLPLRDKRDKRVKIFCWLGIGGIVSSAFVFDVSIPDRDEIAFWIFGILAVPALLQYLLERKGLVPRGAGPTNQE